MILSTQKILCATQLHKDRVTEKATASIHSTNTFASLSVADVTDMIVFVSETMLDKYATHFIDAEVASKGYL